MRIVSHTPGPGFAGQFESGPVMAGIDEAGRGPLAGPVVAAAAVLCNPAPAGLDDSKRLSARRRAALEEVIRAHCAFGIAVVDVEAIDRLNILGATMLAMTGAMAALHDALGAIPLAAQVDGNITPAGRAEGWRWPAEAIVGGDGKVPAISAASILAKEYRDRLMIQAAADWPGYGWDRNKGYGSAQHMAALRQLGPTPLHRRSFSPVAQMELAMEPPR